MVKIYFDGASEPNPGNSSIGVVIIKQKKTYYTLAKNIGFHTNNEAEFIALQKALEKALELRLYYVSVYGDSKIVIESMNKRWKISKLNLLRIKSEIDLLVRSFKKIEFKWIPRESNSKADHYSKIGLNSDQEILKVAKQEVKKQKFCPLFDQSQDHGKVKSLTREEINALYHSK